MLDLVRSSRSVVLATGLGMMINAPVSAATTITLSAADYIYRDANFTGNYVASSFASGTAAVGRFIDSNPSQNGEYASTLEFLLPAIPSDADIIGLSLNLTPSPQSDGHRNTGLDSVQFRSYLAATTGSDPSRLFDGNNLTNNLDLNHNAVTVDLFGGPTVNYVYNGAGQYLGLAFRETSQCATCTSFTFVDYPGLAPATLTITYDVLTPPPPPPSAVPEPATWALTIIGFGTIGASLRQRRRQTARATFA